MERNSIEVGVLLLFLLPSESFVEAYSHFILVSRLFGTSSNYDMKLILDYNIELYPLKVHDSFSLVLASSLVKGVSDGSAANTGADGADEDKDVHQWRPDGKGRRGMEEDYEYVMFGKVCMLDGYG